MAFKRRPTYYYDSESCTYQKEEISIGKWALQNISYFIVIGIFCAGALLSYSQWFHSVKESSLINSKVAVEARLRKMNEKLDFYEEVLDRIYERESGLYASIMDDEAISSQVWEGGMGGIKRYDLENSDLSTQMQVRVELLKHRMRVLSNSLKRIRFQADRRTEELKMVPAIRPVNVMNSTAISGFGFRVHPVTGHGHFHAGLDFACPSGTPIHAAGNGTITFSGASGHGYGIYVDIDHENGYATKYAHMSRVVVEPGQRVKRGEIIGFSGNTGLSTGPHLHYEIERHGEKVNPLDFFYDISPDEYLKKKNLAVAPAMD